MNFEWYKETYEEWLSKQDIAFCAGGNGIKTFNSMCLNDPLLLQTGFLGGLKEGIKKGIEDGFTAALDALMSEARWTLVTESLPKVPVATKMYVKYDTGKIAYAVFHPENPPSACFSSNNCTCAGVVSWQFLPTIDT